MKEWMKGLFDTIIQLCTGANWGVQDDLILEQSNIEIAQTMYRYFLVIGIGMTIVYFLMEMNKQYALQARDLNIKTIGVPFLKLLTAIAVLAKGADIISWILSFNNGLITYAKNNFILQSKDLNEVFNGVSGDTLVGGASFMTLIGMLVPALICWLVGIVVGLVFKYKTLTYKMELIFRTGIAPIALGDVYSGENSTAIKYLKRFLALGLYGMAFVVIVNIGASMIGSGVTGTLTGAGGLEAIKVMLQCLIIPFAELGALGIAKQACSEVLGV